MGSGISCVVKFAEGVSRSETLRCPWNNKKKESGLVSCVIPCIDSNMEAGGDGSPNMTTKLLVPWRNDWEKFKRMFKASARLNGVSDAGKAGEALAKLRKHPIDTTRKQGPAYNKPITPEIGDDQYPTVDSHTRTQAPKLAAMLTPSLADTVGVQQSIITDELEDDEDGIAAWAALVTHFEYSTEDIRAETLFHKWEEESLGCGEHPDVLWARLSSLQRKLIKLGEECNDKNLMRRFISAIDKQPG
ncbi:MAG: hypothetical protein GY789_29555, partial [Hyphomicrobiales bacterium]|nr:hypothetical protein [Hyphomicrobiales bacterium]